MWKGGRGQGDSRKEAGKGKGLVAVAIDRDKNSRNALKWAVDYLLHSGQTVVLIHVKLKSYPSSFSVPSLSVSSPQLNKTIGDGRSVNKDSDALVPDLFLPFRCFCKRKNIECKEVLLEEPDVAKALVEYVSKAAIEVLVVGSSSKSSFFRFYKQTDIPGNVIKSVPDFCTVYTIAKGKIATMRAAARNAPTASPLRAELQESNSELHQLSANSLIATERPSNEAVIKSIDQLSNSFRSPFSSRDVNGRSAAEVSVSASDVSFLSSARPSVDRRTYSSIYENADPSRTSSRLSNLFDNDYDTSFASTPFVQRSVDFSSQPDFSVFLAESDRRSYASQAMHDKDAEMRRLKLELKHTTEMYSSACREALAAKQETTELQRLKLEEERQLGEARMAKEAALAISVRENTKSKTAIETAKMAQRIAELEARMSLKEAEENKRPHNSMVNSDVRYRKYSIDEIEIATEFFAEKNKVGEGGYGPVYKCYLDHTQVAVKVLRPDAAQGRSQFKQELEVLSCMRHPHMVLLLGACPEYGCLVYEYMSNGSLEDRLLRRGNTPPLSWRSRFRIAAEIGTALLFLHQTKPEPLVHRDLKPANILLDRNFTSKIGDVGLARLVPQSVADVTQYLMTATAGTFCYIDPEYQQTGMLCVKSDIYSLGIMFLQILSAKPPMGLTHHAERAIENGTFAEFLDPSVPDWPLQEALEFANMSLKCSELRRKDRPDLAKAVLPLLNRLRDLADEPSKPADISSPGHSPNTNQVSMRLEQMSTFSFATFQESLSR